MGRLSDTPRGCASWPPHWRRGGKSGLRLWLVVVVGFALGLASHSWAQPGRWRAKLPPETPPPAAAVDEARERYQKAIKLYQEEGAVEAALAEMQRAYDLAPHYKVLYNVGQAARTLRDYPLALHAFQRYLADGGEKISAKRRAAVVKEIKELKTYVSAVDIRVNVDGAKITVDDALVGVSPLDDPVMVGAGRVRVRAQLGKQSDARTLVVPGGDQLTVELELAGGDTGATGASSEQGTASTPGESPEPDDGTRASPLLWIGVAAAGAFALGAGITGGLALSNSSDLETVTYAGTEPPDDVTSKQDTVTALAITTDVFIGVAAASLVVTGVLWLVGVGEEPAAEPAETAATAQLEWSLQPWIESPGRAAGAQRDRRWGAALTGRW